MIEWKRLFFKNITDTRGTFHAKMGIIKDRNGRDLTETEDIKKRTAGSSMIHLPEFCK